MHSPLVCRGDSAVTRWKYMRASHRSVSPQMPTFHHTPHDVYHAEQLFRIIFDDGPEWGASEFRQSGMQETASKVRSCQHFIKSSETSSEFRVQVFFQELGGSMCLIAELFFCFERRVQRGLCLVKQIHGRQSEIPNFPDSGDSGFEVPRKWPDWT